MNKYLVENIHFLQDEIDALNKQITELQAQVSIKTGALEEAKKSLLFQMQKEKLEEVEVQVDSGNYFATVFTKSNVEYSSDNDVIAKLKGTDFAKFIKVKTTESLDKNPLKKEIKTNKTLGELLKPLIVESNTTYVVVTNGENHTKMLEHIEENSKKGK